MKTKQALLLSVIFMTFMISMPAHSQFKFGVKAGVDLENPTFGDAFKVENMTSYQLGPAIEAMFPLSRVDFGVDLALLYSDNRMTVNRLRGNELDKVDISNRYLTLPLNAKLKFPLLGEELKVYGLAGPYVGYLISGDKISFPDISNDIKAKKFAGGLNFGFGVELFRLLQVGANYKVQLTDNYADEKPEWSDPLNGKSETWSISLGLFF